MTNDDEFEVFDADRGAELDRYADGGCPTTKMNYNPVSDEALAELRAKLYGRRNHNQHDPVNHPSHYTSHPSGVECIDVTEHFNFNIGNAVKYLWRSGLKETADSVEDLKKAQWYVTREIERLGRTKDKE